MEGCQQCQTQPGPAFGGNGMTSRPEPGKYHDAVYQGEKGDAHTARKAQHEPDIKIAAGECQQGQQAILFLSGQRLRRNGRRKRPVFGYTKGSGGRNGFHRKMILFHKNAPF